MDIIPILNNLAFFVGHIYSFECDREISIPHLLLYKNLKKCKGFILKNITICINFGIRIDEP